MYRGRLVELASRDSLFRNPVHPYTRALIDVIPHADLDHPLDFASIERRSSSDIFFDSPFGSPDEGVRMEMRSVSDEHFVRVIEGTSLAELEGVL